MNVRLITLFFIVCVYSNAEAQSQSPGHQLKLITKAGEDGVWLRWAPTDFLTWQLGNKYGYVIERHTLDSSAVLEKGKTVSLNSTAVRPFTKEALDELSKTVGEAAVIQELIYGSVENNGGENPTALLRQSEEMDNRFGMALLVCDFSLKIAEAAGLFWNDTSAVKGSRYIYKVTISNNPHTTQVEPAVAVVDVNEARPLQTFKDVTVTFGDGKATVSWPVLTHMGVYTAYIVEKSTDGNNFKPITDVPYVPMSEVSEPEEVHFVDSLERNNKQYYYRVKGITPFGEEGPPSNVVSGAGKVDLSGMVVIHEVKRGTKNAVFIRWDFPVTYETSIEGFIVSRARKADGPYIDIMPTRSPAKTREIVDADVSSSSYYHVKAIDKEGKEITRSMPYFFHVEDNIPPSVPTGLLGTADKNGIVTLKWKPNRDNDLLGYRVFSSNSLRDRFVEVTVEFVPDSLYQDSINVRVLNKKVYYKVVAVDNNYNNSDYSKPCTVVRPDILAPAVPVFSKVEVKDKVISVNWINSISDDVSNSTLYRTTTPDNDNTLTIKASMLSWSASNTETSFVDNTARQGKAYQYVIETSDSAGNMSTAVSRKIIIQSNVPEDVTDFKALINREEKTITLKWSYAAAAKKCLLYRKKNDELFSLYQTIEGTSKEFIDKQIIVSNTYAYKIQLVLETNAKTKLSETLKVSF